MLTLRRGESAVGGGGSTRSLVTRRQMTNFLSCRLPALMQSPPGGSASFFSPARNERSNTGRRGGSDGPADSAEARALKRIIGGKGDGKVLTLAEQIRELAGTGSVPWTTELAESVLLTTAQASRSLSNLWASDAAIQFLLHDAARSTASAADVPRGSNEEVRGGEMRGAAAVDLLSNPGTAPLPHGLQLQQNAKRIGERARFAMAMLQSQQVAKRRARLRETLLVPARRQLLRLHRLKAPSADATSSSSENPPTDSNLHDGAASVSARHAPRVSDVSSLTSHQFDYLPRNADLDTYLHNYLLPSLFNELRQFCEEVGRRYDAAVAAAAAATATTSTTTIASTGTEEECKANESPTNLRAANALPPPPVTLNDSCLPSLSGAEQETFAVLLSVLYRTLLQRGVVRPSAHPRGSRRHQHDHRGDQFYFHPFQTIATTPDTKGELAEGSIQHLDGLPLRAFAITLSSVASTADRIAGPRSGLLEKTLRRASENRAALLSLRGGEDSEGGEGGEMEGAAHAQDGAHRTAGDSGSGGGGPARLARTPAPHPARFQSRKDLRDASASAVPGQPTTLIGNPSAAQPAVARSCGAKTLLSHHKSHGRLTDRSATTTAHKTALPPFSFPRNFNLEPHISTLKFCYHDHALQLLIDTAGVHPREGRTSEGTPSEAAHHATPSHAEMRLEDYVNAIAQASLTLLQVALHWAPLCRTTQLPAVAHAVAHILRYPHTPSALMLRDVGSGAAAPTASSGLNGREAEAGENDRGAVAAAPKDEAPPQRDGTTTTTTTLDYRVHARLHQLFLAAYPDGTAFERMTRRLLRSTFRYLMKQVTGTFLSTAAPLDQIFSHWPRELSGSTGSTPTRASNREPPASRQGVVCYTAPTSATTDVLLFGAFMEECWRKLMRQEFWKSIPSAGVLPFGGGDGSVNRAVLCSSVNPNDVKRERKSTELQLWVSSDEEGGWSSGNDGAVAPLAETRKAKSAAVSPDRADHFYLLLQAPLFVQSWLHDQLGNSIATVTPDIMMKLLRIMDHITNYLAIPSVGGRTHAALSLLREWRATPFVSDVLSGSEELFFATREMRLYVASMGLPTVLMKPASADAPCDGADSSLGGASSSPFSATSSPLLSPSSRDAGARLAVQQCVQRVSSPPTVLIHWMARINPLGLYVTPTNRLCSTSALALRKSEEANPQRTSVDRSAEQRTGDASGETVPLLRDLRESTLFWLPTWRESSFSLHDTATLLRALNITCLAEQRKSMAASPSSNNAGSRNTRTNSNSNSSSQLDGVHRGTDQSTVIGLQGCELHLPVWDGMGPLELLLRASHRMLFAPQDRVAASQLSTLPTDAPLQGTMATTTTKTEKAKAADATEVAGGTWQERGADALFEGDPPASLEALVTLYLSLLAATRESNAQLAETAPGTSSSNSSGRSVQHPSERAKAAQQTLVVWAPFRSPRTTSRYAHIARCRTVLRCCLAECESVLQDRLRTRRSTHTTVGVTAKDEENTEEGNAPASCGAPRRGGDRAADDLASSLEALLELSMLAEAVWPRGHVTQSEGNAARQGSSNGSSRSSRRSCGEALLPQQLLALFQQALVARLRASSLREMAALLSNQLWWTAQQQQQQQGAAAAAATTAQVPACASWVEQTILNVLEEKIYSTSAQAQPDGDARATVKENSRVSREHALLHRSFEVYEWVLMPWYLKLELRRHTPTRSLPCFPSDTTAAAIEVTMRPSTSVLDDFTSLEDAFDEHSDSADSDCDGVAPIAPSTLPRPITTVRCVSGAGTSIELHTSLLLERALNALVSHCESFDTFLHVVRYLFLSHPVTLTTAPIAAVQLDAMAAALTPSPRSRSSADGASGWSTTTLSSSAAAAQRQSLSFAEAWQASNACSLPQQWVTVPQSLRYRYVDTLYRLFVRLIYLPNTTLEDLFELLHVLWLADPSASRPDLSSSAAAVAGGGDGKQRGSRRTTGGAAAASTWPSLFQRCADFTVQTLSADKHDDAVLDGQRQQQQRLTVPVILQNLRLILEKGLLTVVGSVNEPMCIAAMQLPPVPVLLFLSGLATQVRDERAAVAQLEDNEERDQDQSSPRLTPAQHAVLDLLEPFVLYTVVTSEMLFDLPKATYLPLFLEVLSGLEPRLVLNVIQAAFTGRATDPRRAGRGRRFISSSESSVVGGPKHIPIRSMFSGGSNQFEEHARCVAAIVSSMVMVAGQAQASSLVWASVDSQAAAAAAAEEEEEEQTSGATDKEGEATGELRRLLPGSSAPVTLLRKDDTRVQVGRAHRRALGYLSGELYRHLMVPLHWQPLRLTDPAMLLRLLQIFTVRRHRRLHNTLVYLIFRLLTTTAVVSAGWDGVHARPPPCLRVAASASRRTDAAAKQHRDPAPDPASRETPRTALSPVGHLLLRQLSLSQWREFFYRDLRHGVYIPYQRRLKLRRIKEIQLQRQQRGAALFSTLTETAGTSHEVRQRADVEVNGASVPWAIGVMESTDVYRERITLGTVVLTLDAASTQTLVHDIMSPSVLLTFTADLLQRHWWNRRSTGRQAEEVLLARTGLGAADTAALDAAQESSPSPSSASTYAVLLRYASVNSVLREAALQPFLKAAGEVLDQLASAKEQEFLAVLSREAAWLYQAKGGAAQQQRQKQQQPQQRDVREGNAASRQRDLTATAANESGGNVSGAGVREGRHAGAAAVAAATGPSAQVGDIGGDELDAAESPPEEAAEGKEANAVDPFRRTAETPQEDQFADLCAAGPLVLDWQPIARLLRVIYHVDPGVMERQLREAWRSRRGKALPVASPVEAPLQRDVFHGGIDAMLHHVGEVWRASPSATAARVGGDEPSAPQPHHHPPPPPQRLVVMNLHLVLEMYAPYMRGVPSSYPHQHNCSSSSGSSSADWLDAGPVSGGAASSSSVSSAVFNDDAARMEPLVWTVRAFQTATTVTADGKKNVVAAEMARRARRAALMRRAGMLISAQEAEWAIRTSEGAKSAGRESPDDGEDEKMGRMDPDVYWQERLLRLHQRVVECVFGEPESLSRPLLVPAANTSTSVQMAGSGNPEPETASTTADDYVRQVHQRLELMRSDDVAQLLGLLLRLPDADGASRSMTEATVASAAAAPHTRESETKVMQARVLMETLTDLLPSASQREVVRVTQDLLQRYVDVMDAGDAPATTASTTGAAPTAASARAIAFEIRRLLSSVGVLLANDVERVTTAQLVWLLSRLHTPRLRGVASVVAEKGKDAADQSQRTRPAEAAGMALDVSESFLSAAVARTLTIVLADASAFEAPPPVMNVDAAAAATEPGKSNVLTVGQWMTAVSAAELQPSSTTVTALLRLIEASAL
ncbi:hypothetical protein ABB37_01947 [Leptomonas pyrrhocoris]|uniref:Uncharacterized protein n=1 Tax=Leptomonas pyrrhocoris TaxID=157538 RepID=A0A0N0DY48_LEPPY|nr:hypothetical protein ABB37_01947 [Leptomonas pyrrhocoris]KPA83691.1 hypothetical protein ABB37_01947 [Leptomonas pyrrhocoris]|eukprot:XP_015662130.1 hypothetical protein ABB37_01947 [Leptomonas pyrrhocoris]